MEALDFILESGRYSDKFKDFAQFIRGYSTLLDGFNYKPPKFYPKKQITLRLDNILYIIDTKGKMYIDSNKGRRTALAYYNWDNMGGGIYQDGILYFIYIKEDKYEIQHKRICSIEDATKVINRLK